jgi:TPR repeat protein
MSSSDRDKALASARVAMVTGDFQTAIDLLSPLANAGDSEAEFLLGSLYLTEYEGMPAKAAFEWFKKAAKQDHPEACYHLYTFPESCEFVSPLDDSERVALLIRAGELGSLDAQYDLGASYATGDWPGPKDEAEAVKWYTKVAKQGSLEAQFNLGFMLLEGEGGRQDSNEGIAWIEKASDGGHDQARRLLAEIYAKGIFGISKDLVASRHRRVEELGPSIKDIWPLGLKESLMLIEGRVEEVERRLLDFYEAAKVSGDPDSLRTGISCLAHFYSLPFGQDLVQAEKYFEDLMRQFPGVRSGLEMVFFRYYTLRDRKGTIEVVSGLRSTARERPKRELTFLYSAVAVEGMAYLELGQHEEAKASLRELLDWAQRYPQGMPFGDEYNFVEQMARCGIAPTVWRELAEIAGRGTRSQEYRDKFERLLASNSRDIECR